MQLVGARGAGAWEAALDLWAQMAGSPAGWSGQAAFAPGGTFPPTSPGGMPPGAAFPGMPGSPQGLDLGVYQMWNQWVMQVAMAGSGMVPAEAAPTKGAPAAGQAKPGPAPAPKKAAGKSKKATTKKAGPRGKT